MFRDNSTSMFVTNQKVLNDCSKKTNHIKNSKNSTPFPSSQSQKKKITGGGTKLETNFTSHGHNHNHNHNLNTVLQKNNPYLFCLLKK